MFAALSCAATMVIQIPIATGYLNFGDGLCLLAGWILGTFAKQSKLIHDSLDTLVIYQKATVQKLPMHPSYAISFPVLIKNGNDFGR